jgi:hypothetical protein
MPVINCRKLWRELSMKAQVGLSPSSYKRHVQLWDGDGFTGGMSCAGIMIGAWFKSPLGCQNKLFFCL